MQKDHYKYDFRPIMIDHGNKQIFFLNPFKYLLFFLGYDSIYIKRSGDKSDGCCLFYKSNRLKLVASKTVPFYQRNIQLLDR